MNYDAKTCDYVEKRRAEGKTEKDIRRCVNRYLARLIFRILTASARAKRPRKPIDRHRRVFGEPARAINPIATGRMRSHGKSYPTAPYRLLTGINALLVHWIRNKYRRYDSRRRGIKMLLERSSKYLRLFWHRQWDSTTC